MIKIICDWICEFCYKPCAGNLPSDWEFIFQSAICPDCIIRAKSESKLLTEIKGGEYAYISDPRGHA